MPVGPYLLICWVHILLLSVSSRWRSVSALPSVARGRSSGSVARGAAAVSSGTLGVALIGGRWGRVPGVGPC